MDELQMLGYITYTLEPDTKILTYRITDWIVKCSGKACSEGDNIYTTPEYGFICMPRNITERLVEKGHKFGEADAWLDLWCHTVFQNYCSYFSLHRLPGSFGCVIYNRCYPTQDECDDPSDEEVMRILELIVMLAAFCKGNTQVLGQGGFAVLGSAGDEVRHFAPSTVNLSPSRISSR